MQVSITITGDSSDKEVLDLVDFLAKYRGLMTPSLVLGEPLDEFPVLSDTSKNSISDISNLLNLLSSENRALFNVLSPIKVECRAVVATEDVINASGDPAVFIKRMRNGINYLTKNVFSPKKFKTMLLDGDLVVIRIR